MFRKLFCNIFYCNSLCLKCRLYILKKCLLQFGPLPQNYGILSKTKRSFLFCSNFTFFSLNAVIIYHYLLHSGIRHLCVPLCMSVCLCFGCSARLFSCVSVCLFVSISLCQFVTVKWKAHILL